MLRALPLLIAVFFASSLSAADLDHQKLAQSLADTEREFARITAAIAGLVARGLFGLDRGFVWSDAESLPERIEPYRHLMTRVDPKQLDALFEPEKERKP